MQVGAATNFEGLFTLLSHSYEKYHCGTGDLVCMLRGLELTAGTSTRC